MYVICCIMYLLNWNNGGASLNNANMEVFQNCKCSTYKSGKERY